MSPSLDTSGSVIIPESSVSQSAGALRGAHAEAEPAAASGISLPAQVVVQDSFYSSWADQTQPSALTIGDYRLHLTCSACPEQYDVFLGERQVGYLRLRHGGFTAETPYCGGTLVYEAEPEGDGIFEPEERFAYLVRAIDAIRKATGPSAADTSEPQTQVPGGPNV